MRFVFLKTIPLQVRLVYELTVRQSEIVAVYRVTKPAK